MTRVIDQGRRRRYDDDVEPRTLLVHHLRERLGKVGTVVGCDTSNCGACTVLMTDADGQPAGRQELLPSSPCRPTAARSPRSRACPAPTTRCTPCRRAFHEPHALQCGFCTPGMIMAAVDLLEENPDPSEHGDPRGAGGQPLPVHRLPEHRAGGPRGGDEIRRGSGDRRAGPPSPLAGEAQTPDSGLPRQGVPDEAIPQPVP